MDADIGDSEHAAYDHGGRSSDLQQCDARRDVAHDDQRQRRVTCDFQDVQILQVGQSGCREDGRGVAAAEHVDVQMSQGVRQESEDTRLDTAKTDDQDSQIVHASQKRVAPIPQGVLGVQIPDAASDIR